MGDFTRELKEGTVTLAVLSQLRAPQSGYLLSRLLEQADVDVDPGRLYPLLRRLEKEELVTGSWEIVDNRERKYYVLTERGQEVLAQLKKEWRKLSGLVKGEEDDEAD